MFQSDKYAVFGVGDLISRDSQNALSPIGLSRLAYSCRLRGDRVLADRIDLAGLGEIDLAFVDTSNRIRRAAAALENGDVAEARAYWRLVREATDAPVEAWLLAAEHAVESYGPDSSVALLEAGVARFPDESRLLLQLAQAKEKAGEWAAAENYWRSYILANASPWWVHAALAKTIRNQGKVIESEELLAELIRQFPENVDLFGEFARAAQARGDWAEALRRWEVVITRFPGRWNGFRGKFSALAGSGQSAAAEDLVAARAGDFPNDPDALHDFARWAERRQDWRHAESIWRSFMKLHQPRDWIYLALAGVLICQEKFAEAESVLHEARQHFPNHTPLAIASAKCSERSGDTSEALRRWKSVSGLSPKSPEGALGEAALLRHIGQSSMADTVIEAALTRLPDEPSLQEAFGLNAMAREAWAEACARFEAAQRRFPSHNGIRRGIQDSRLRMVDNGSDAVGHRDASPQASEEAAADRELAMQFESLGGRGHGCEFGIFQRHFGAEPLGLLRWADLSQDSLCRALETEFAGVGDIEFTNLFVPGAPTNTEYWTTDTRYHMAMRCFVSTNDVPFDRMRQQVTKRLQFLRRKLIDDLKSGSKIFVFKNMKENLTETELMRLHAACGSYGDNTLLYIRYADADHPNGTVIEQANGLLVGYIDHFTHTPVTDEYIGPSADSLLSICRNAHKLWSVSHGAAPADRTAIAIDSAVAGLAS